MEKLIEAMQIFLKYKNSKYTPLCEYDFFVVNIERDVISAEDLTKLNELGFFWEAEYDCFRSYKYGSA